MFNALYRLFNLLTFSILYVVPYKNPLLISNKLENIIYCFIDSPLLLGSFYNAFSCIFTCSEFSKLSATLYHYQYSCWQFLSTA